jgi:ribose 5-phosphate isomerase B
VRVAIGSDHAGFALKEDLKRLLDELQIAYDDLGPPTDAAVDYPEYASAVSHAVIDGRADRGILICGTGVGMSIAANKIAGIRAALLTSVETARLSREHNDANVMALGGRTTTSDVAHAIVRTFLATPFAGGRHALRVAKITRLESCPDQRRTESS